MSANPKLVKMIWEWRQLDAQGAAAETAKKSKKSDAVTARATRLIHAIGDMEATSVDDIILKLDLACEAYGAATQPRDKFIEAGDPPLDFLYQSLLDARRLLANPVKSAEQDAALKAADIVSSMEDGMAALVDVCNAMGSDSAEDKALIFVTDKLGEDVSAIGKAIDTIRGLPAAKPEAA
jgi:hypothetical protein